MKFRLKVYAIGSKTASNIDLQGDTIELDSADLESKTKSGVKEKFKKLKQELLDRWIVQNKGIFVRMKYKGALVEPKGFWNRKWREKIAEQIDFEEPIYSEFVKYKAKEIKKDYRKKVKIKKPLYFKEHIGLERWKGKRKRSYVRIVARDSRGRFMKGSHKVMLEKIMAE